MLLALVSAIVLSPIYADRRKIESHLEMRWSSGGLVLPVVVVAGLIVAIRTTNSSSKNHSLQKGSQSHNNGDIYRSPDDNNCGASLVFRIGSSSWGLAGILVMLIFVISWQDYVKHIFWR
ncbi:serine rich protein [Striga asiatica]|uniref:Serine rich protein n=1 Tax=Striga asiatica TaxID=4170 RepID=A0A5A7R800_STRAF|nr:serine rich protein [Striga asiatica]